MLLLLPYSRYRVEYQIAYGRPYSIFERLILRAILEGASTVEQLQRTFCVHPRLILEALVTLTQAGWLAIGGEGASGFSLTSAGHDAVASGHEPKSRKIESRSAWIAMERVTGALAIDGTFRRLRSGQVKDQLSEAQVLRERVFSRRLNEGQVEPLLPRARTEWLYKINSIEMMTRQADWIPVELDAQTCEFDDNLPSQWRARLATHILDQCRPLLPAGGTRTVKTSIASLGEITVDREPRRLAIPLNVGPSDFLLSDPDHGVYLRRVLQTCSSRLLIATAFLRTSCLQALKDDIVDALKRGVGIDFLWGYNTGPEGDVTAIDLLKKIAYDAKRDSYKGKLRFNASASGSHAKLVIWDQNDRFEACIGSFNWLSAVSAVSVDGEPPRKLNNVSVCVHNPAIIARLIRTAASLWSQSGARLDATPDRWRRVAATLDQLDAEAPEMTAAVNSTARLVVDLEHDALMRSWLTLAHRRLIIVSHRLGIAAETRLVAAADRQRDPDFQFLVCYGISDLEKNSVFRLAQIVTDAGGIMQESSGMHAKLMVSDTSLCVGSYNFLSTDVYGRARRTKELSIEIRGAEPADHIVQRLKGIGSAL